MLRFLGRRLLAIIPVVLVVTFIVFVLIDLAPGDAATQLAGDTATDEQVKAIRSELHLDEPFFERYWDWLSDAAQGDFGTSYVTKKPVVDSILDGAPVTLSLGLVSLVMAIGIGVALGVIGALKPRGFVDRGITALSSVMLAVPAFWLALVLILLFAVQNQIFPSIGYASLLDDGPYEWLRHLILPAFALAVAGAATIALQLKAALVAEDGSDYLLAARAKGLTRNTLLFKHSFKNAAVPVVTILGFRVATLLGGTVIIETIFVLPGLGLMAREAALQQDVPMVLGIVTFTAVFILVINVLVDASYGYINPKLPRMTGIADVFTPEVDLGPEWAEARPPAPRRGRVLRRLIRNPAAVFGLVIVLLVLAMAIFAPLLAPHDPDVQDLLGKLQPPSAEHWFGTDESGRDLLSRIIFGARVSVTAAIEAVAIGGLVGTTLGMIAGFRGGRFDSVSSRVVEVTMALPGFLLAVTVVAVFGPGLTTTMFAVGFLLTPVFFRVSRASTQDVREETYIEASHALGCTTRRTVLRHVLPNAIAPVIVQVAILLGVAITIEASLSFIGLGAQAPTASWGNMLSNANSYMSQAPYLMYIPGAMIAITVLAFSLLGDGLAAALGTTRSSVAERGR